MRYLLLLAFLSGCGCTLIESCDKTPKSKVVSIGGCDKRGTCSAMLESGHKVIADYPVTGESLYISHCRP